ncbi:hypothetical protein YC2023_024675 [Brassica napus]
MVGILADKERINLLLPNRLHIGSLIEKADAFAAVFPEQKYEIVKKLQELKHICRMTGDGCSCFEESQYCEFFSFYNFLQVTFGLYLDVFYSEPQRYAYTFQNYMFVTRLMQEKEFTSGVKPLRLMERSVFSDRMVFVRAVHEAKWMNEMEISIYDCWFDHVVSALPGVVPDGFIYLRAIPDTCHKRMMLRKRAEEGGVSLKYLQDLHEKHESWLLPFDSGNHGVLSVSKPSLQMDNSLHPDIKDRVFYLEMNHMHSSIQKVPALFLDCEPNIDFSRDIEAKRQYTRKVAEFFEFV